MCLLWCAGNALQEALTKGIILNDAAADFFSELEELWNEVQIGGGREKFS
ncbi:hypothetical protein BN940_00906 [Castellaniella defragrans 65Phen]|uniref:Uncharacterized protein n=1 Tax=Castellaniella defragrans (strain DSM 12143 / CCUG 39792 / 65Phen) TaxID=1437824 RepID=W8WSN3_CASD6|nr:hypothetical protein BN940_00906 [Castellaniella defragrans 65Phen]